jgi:hypothetical protein
MITLIKDATTTGTSQGVSVVSGSDTGHDIHSFQAVFTGSPTALTLSILGTIDSVNYNCLLSHTMTSEEITDGTALFHLINKTVPKIKVSIDTLTGGVSPQVSVYYFKGSVSV